jgi:hypothetical protein
MAALLSPAAAAAKLCGDDVEGRDVPCACGDIIVSDVVLGDDPVTDEVCPREGLLVRAPGGRTALTIDLKGHTLRGTRVGAGILVLYGGPGGARVLSSRGTASLDGFYDGVRAQGRDTVSLVDHVRAVHSVRDGFHVDGDGYEIRDAEARESGRDGFALGGKRFRVTDTRAVRSHRHGYLVTGQDAVIAGDHGNESDESGATGFTVHGKRHRLIRCSASGAGQDGVRVSGPYHDVRRCKARRNGGDGIRGQGSDWIVADNCARDNGGSGIVVEGPKIHDVGGNSGRKNQGAKRRRGAECTIGGRRCRA